MEKIKNYLSSLGSKKNIRYSLIIVLLIGGGIYLTQEYIINKNPSKYILKIIPKESAFVMSFTPSNFLAKMNVEDLLETELGENAEDFIKDEDVGILEDLFEDPSISGVDYLSEVFVFHSYEDAEEHYFCISAGIQNDNKFSEFLKDAFKEVNVRIKIKEEDRFNYFVEENGFGIVWDDDKFILMVGTTDEDDLEDHMEKLMTLEEDDRITSNEHFNDFYENRQDVSVWISTELIDEFEDAFEDAFRYELRDVERELGITTQDIIKLCDDNIVTFHINFGDGELICSSDFIPNKDLQDLLTKNNLFDVEFNKEILEFVPDNNIALFSQKINVNNYFELIKEYIDASDINKFEREMGKEIGLNIDDILNTFG